MALSLGLIISLSFTTLLCVLLFFYIRQRTSSIDTKLNSLLDFVHDEVSKTNVSYVQNNDVPSITVTQVDNSEKPEESVDDGETNNTDFSSESESDSLSDVESDNEQQEDLISVSTNGEDIQDKETPTIPTASNIQDSISDIAMFTNVMKKNENIIEPDRNEDADNELSEIESLDLEEEKENHNDENDVQEETETNTENKVDDEKVETQENTNQDKNENLSGMFNLKKLSVTQLRDMVSEKKLHETPKKLKKHNLIKLLEG